MRERKRVREKGLTPSIATPLSNAIVHYPSYDMEDIHADTYIHFICTEM